MFKGLGDLASLMKQASEMKGMVGEMQEKLGRVRVTGSAGGGMVEVEASGHQKVLSCTISERLAATGDREMLEDLVVAATNQALAVRRSSASNIQATRIASRKAIHDRLQHGDRCLHRAGQRHLGVGCFLAFGIRTIKSLAFVVLRLLLFLVFGLRTL